MFWLILLLSLLLAFLTAYTMAMQKTTLSIGRLLVNKSPDEPGAGVQDAITPKTQTTRNLLMFCLFPVIFGLTAYQYAWYHGIWVVLVCFFGSSILKLIPRLHPGSPRLVASIAKNLSRHQQAFLKSGDTIRAEVTGQLIAKLGNLSLEDIRREAGR